MQEIWHIIFHSLIDSLKLFVPLFIIYLIIEFVEHKRQGAFLRTIGKAKRLGPLIGGIVGTVPQCGFSGIMSDLYSKKLVTLGTLIAVFMTTSDEALPILISSSRSAEDVAFVLILLGTKLAIGVAVGFLIDFAAVFVGKLSEKKEIYRRSRELLKAEKSDSFNKTVIEADCGNHHGECGCHHEGCEKENFWNGCLLPALRHSAKIFVFIFIASIVFGVLIHFISEERLSYFLLSGSFFQPLLSALIGLIPNCAASVLLTELYLGGTLSFASLIAGLSSGAGIGLLVLYRTNRNLRENIAITLLLYLASSGVGMILSLFIR